MTRKEESRLPILALVRIRMESEKIETTQTEEPTPKAHSLINL